MINIDVTFGQQADLGMPMSGSAPVAIVRALPTWGAVSVSRPKCVRFDATTVAGYGVITTDVAVLEGAFSGTSAWSPPI